MSDFAARISRIRMKSGGAEVSLIRNERAERGEEDWRGAVVRNAKRVAELASEEAPLVGYLLIGFYSDGSASSGFRIDHAGCPVPVALMPSWVAEIVRRDLIVDTEAENKFHDMFHWVDGA